MAYILREQEAPRRRESIPRVIEACFSSSDNVQEVEAILSCTLDRSLDQLPIALSTPETQSFREVVEMTIELG